MANNAANGVLSPVFGDVLALVGVLGSSGVVGDSGFSLIVTVCPSSDVYKRQHYNSIIYTEYIMRKLF